MSADNTLLIHRDIDDKYKGYVVFGEQTELDKPVFTADTMMEAVNKANEYCKENLVEYGYRFV